MRKTFNVKANVSYPDPQNDLHVRVAFKHPSGKNDGFEVNVRDDDLIQLFAKPYVSVVFEQNEDGRYTLLGLNGSSIPPEDEVNDDFEVEPSSEVFGKFLN